MPETVLLRFRDHRSDIDTIRAHLDIIAQYRYVWWGWWRKESEPDRRRELEKLQFRARQNPVTIGLFDRSTERYFVAQAADFIRDEERRGAPELDRAPAYYSRRNTIEAWVKLLSIEPTDSAEFTERFGEVPVGEHTFFPVSRDPRPVGDASRPYLGVQSDFVVHVSDLHFGADYGFPSVRRVGEQPLIARLREDLRNLCGDHAPGLVIVSGDLTSRADANALDIEALDFLNAVHNELRVPKEAILVIPGNHDFRLNHYEPTNFSHERPFNQMLREFYGKYDPDERIRCFSFPSGHRAEFLLMNSVRLRKVEESNYGYVEWSLYDNRLRLIPKDPDVTRVAVLHHHLVSMAKEEFYDEDYKHAGISTTLDSGAVIEGLQTHGFRLALHGHQHVPGIARISRGVIDGDNAVMPHPDLFILAAGSAGAKVERLTPLMRDNSYNLLSFGQDDIRIDVRRYNSGLAGSRYFLARVAQ
jgi:hypothetical protein